MESTPALSARNALFQKLKPCCVKISQLAIKDPEAQSTQRELLNLSNELLSTLNAGTKSAESPLDDKLAEYVFFPLYHIFRQLDVFPMLLIENCVKCLNVLIVHGWKASIPSKMVQQVLTLLTFIIDGVPGSDKNREVPEETVLESFRTLTSLFKIAQSSVSVAAGLAEEAAIPALGHGITVMLEGASTGTTDAIQTEALRALQGVYLSLRDHAAEANFLPGIISSLAKLLAAPSRQRKIVLAESLNTISLVLTRVLGDLKTRSIIAKGEDKDTETDAAEKNKILSPAWLKATTAQVKVALSTIMKLRTHEAVEVRRALCRLCVRLLDECHTSLSDCAFFLVETSIILDENEAPLSLSETTLRDLLRIYPELADKAKAAVYGWTSSLPRLMQSGDEDGKRRAVHNLSKGIGFLQDLSIESETLGDIISDTLRDSTVALMSSTKAQPAVVTQDISSLGNDGSLVLGGKDSQYPPALLSHQSQKGVRSELLHLLAVLGSKSDPSTLALNMLGHVRASGSAQDVAAFWLCFELVKAAHSSTAEEEAFVDFSAFEDSGGSIDMVFQDLVSFSVEILDSYSETGNADWRLEAVAMEVTAYAAKRSGVAFRPELIDVLFPVATVLGSSNSQLRQHAIIALNEIAASCEYGSVSELIIENVDYMVNSVALRLNTLDISPASTQVLTMMIRLTGPRLVPFLDDVVESIFAALENYHGYPVFVESLFGVLKELVDQAVKSDTLLLEEQKESKPNHAKKRLKPQGLDGLLEFIDKRHKRLKYEEEENRTKKASQGHPTRPWKDDTTGDGDDEDSGPPPESEKPPNSTTYQLLLRITTLTQHYLTSPTPKLRRSLLELVSTASTALAADEDAFLPLVNAIWPVVVSRLHDPESFIAIEACHALAALCAAAGDFMSSRFQTEWDDGMRDWCRKVKRQVLSSSSRAKAPSSEIFRGTGDSSKIMIPAAGGGIVEGGKSVTRHSAPADSGALGQHSSPVRLWEAVVKLLTSLIRHVRVTDGMFDDILDILAEVMERSDEVREALETINADAVWLARYERGNVRKLPTPQMEGITFPPMELST